MNFVTIVGTRPELIKLSKIIPLLDKYFNHTLIHTGQNFDYELNEIFFKDLKIRKPDYFLNIKSNSTLNSVGKLFISLDKLLDKLKPDSSLIYGDTNSCLSAIALKKKKIPIFHLEAGNRSFDENVPEEVNRRIIDHVSDINLVLTEHARRYLIKEGLRQDFIIKVGSCMKEVLISNYKKINSSKILNKLKLKKKNYFLFSFHREENVDNKSRLKDIIDSLKKISDNFNKKCIISTHPRTKNRLEKLGLLKNDINILFSKPLGFFDYNKLQINSFCTLSDSGTITEESDLLAFPAVTIRESHERPEGMDAGTLIMSGINYDNIIQSINFITNSDNYMKRDKVIDYDTSNTSYKVLKIILSYTEMINKKVWFKNQK